MYLLGVKAALPPSCAVVMKSGNLNILEPSGPLQACNGTALHLPLTGHEGPEEEERYSSTLFLTSALDLTRV